MRSSTGQHYIALDHVRALAVFLVFCWHFLHCTDGQGPGGTPVPFSSAPTIFPFAFIDEGHVGVALFMTLSGYLFAKLLQGKSISYPLFLYNRVLRLFPLLFLALALLGIKQVLTGVSTIPGYLRWMASGLIYPTLPGGAWSITVECHFYIILPVLLWLSRKSRWLPLMVIACAIALRCAIYEAHGELQTEAYYTIIGRIDQFVFGMMAFHLRDLITKRHTIAASIALVFAAIYWVFDHAGGYNSIPERWVWIIMPTIEGLACSSLIAWYDTSFDMPRDGVSKFIGMIGTYSFSIYLVQFVVVFRMSRYIHAHIADLSNFYVATAWALIAFSVMIPIGYLSYRFIEKPFLRYRTRYVDVTPSPNRTANSHARRLGRHSPSRSM